MTPGSGSRAIKTLLPLLAACVPLNPCSSGAVALAPPCCLPCCLRQDQGIQIRLLLDVLLQMGPTCQRGSKQRRAQASLRCSKRVRQASSEGRPAGIILLAKREVKPLASPSFPCAGASPVVVLLPRLVFAGLQETPACEKLPCPWTHLKPASSLPEPGEHAKPSSRRLPTRLPSLQDRTHGSKRGAASVGGKGRPIKVRETRAP